MAPELEYTSNPQAAGWGQRLEQIRFWSTPADAKEWFDEANLPKIITPESLVGAPDSALAIFRSAIRFPLLEGIAVGKPEYDYPDSNSEVVNIVENLIPERLQVGDIYNQPWDNNRTKNLVLPLFTNKGTIEVVVNPAWGVNWRLAENHPLSGTHPQLTMVQNPDLSEPPIVDEEKPWGPRYLPVEVLAQVTEERVNPEQLIEETKTFLTELSGEKDFTIDQGGLITGNNTLGEHYFSQIIFVFIRPCRSSNIKVRPRRLINKCHQECGCGNRARVSRLRAKVSHIRYIALNHLLIFLPQWKRPTSIPSNFSRLTQCVDDCFIAEHCGAYVT